MKKNTVVLLSLFIGILFFLSIKYVMEDIHKPEGVLIDGEWFIYDGNETIATELPSYTHIADEGIYTYSTTFDFIDANTLVIPSFSAYGFEIRINDLLIGKLNEPESKTSNIWNQIHTITFDPSILQKKNTLEIKIFGIFDHGILQIPYLTNQKNILAKITFADFLQDNIFYISFGICLSFGFILMMLGWSIPDKKNFHYSFGATAFFAGIYLLDFPNRAFSGGMGLFLFERKIIYISTYLALLFLLRGMEFFIFGRKICSKYLTIVISGFATVLLFIPNFKFLKTVNTYGFLILLFMVVLIFLYILIKRQTDFIFSATFLFLCAIHDMVNALTGINSVYLISYGIIVMIMSIEVIIINFFKNTYSNMIQAHDKALKDPLTGAFNRNILDSLNIEATDALIMIDFDKFKMINDRYGHDEGDFLLTLFVKETVAELRNEDKVIRMGGDEFLVYLKNCTKNNAEKRIKKIQELISSKITRYAFGFSYGICNLNCGLGEALKKTDDFLYHMKRQRKDKVNNDD